ncbi:MAG: sugar ABC transporter ATP-binding protein [Christensenella sp.]|uniref:sugar ABC transporter ATP-binding protein n=1 Tax=Christensenella sp. TaxID=1935934 RepID=UPI002B217123|nr:sugar ABC transporter ATP-binding protein [Christensenella sp.]MEA5003604.1 sugar ABC transporter ATP-binding protein [Christensenella sp.]
MTKTYGVVTALKDVDFTINAGEVHALMGENGAGKSTLAKLISGIERADTGEIFIDGTRREINVPSDAIKNGISIVMQEFNSMPHLPVYENIFLGHPDLFKKGVFKKNDAIRRTHELLGLFDMQDHINPEELLSELSVAEQQIVEIIKAVSYDSKIIFFDEPTASLTSNEALRLFEVMRRLKGQGLGMVIVSHRFSEIFEISDRITVLRDGLLMLGNEDMKQMTEQKLVKAMVGHEIKDFYGEKLPLQEGVQRKPMLKVEHLSDTYNFIKDLSFEAYTGEILGFSGLVGAGRTQLARCIFGADPRKSGTVTVDGNEIKNHSPASAIRAGLSLATENRKQEGLILNMSILQNSAFAKTASAKTALLPHKAEQADCKRMIGELNIKVSSEQNPVSSLSGGNQQKVVLSKWLLTDPKVFILDEPTRGIDISAKVEIYNILHALAAQGICVVVISSELPELLGICDRILIMRDGVIVADMNDKHEFFEENIMNYASFGDAGSNHNAAEVQNEQ